MSRQEFAAWERAQIDSGLALVARGDTLWKNNMDNLRERCEIRARQQGYRDFDQARAHTKSGYRRRY